jgi:hypothetical protein
VCVCLVRNKMRTVDGGGRGGVVMLRYLNEIYSPSVKSNKFERQFCVACFTVSLVESLIAFVNQI